MLWHIIESFQFIIFWLWMLFRNDKLARFTIGTSKAKKNKENMEQKCLMILFCFVQKFAVVKKCCFFMKKPAFAFPVELLLSV